ncbi:cob(I)yrinic acid a,c-diamide adenosyltransferase [Halorubrum ezzemoulense]|uniref:Cob(I)alamin adenolsyltransferase n=1 Tax=Halorubrum ezzemoulense TaxID=337243 RepID=A0A256K0F3_HALEZ|nr:cob(I)yrinic acid a,c-diamide adenosyltransferase [Halorubrum ezzemoulense]MDB2241402.1 cob(I)yrinic acid a,c-diamide adenosyltransferase [Halorubrum ezzemoulense]MDB2245104.1 cob(I)yrinic acid a,c-diamide adenosyltransferase [Halorubrum ezzemoulense]MDB2252590.1 cob(I)yrinic acid a,c-diamide adenosyltransferase [Halorubrum ezzemoulense]MDB2263618.1 cob(I)yrinic acid a,c-diamide adenosyltransferase [Halorubrum ezzemoulense]MDB2278138.1 cob(I)yrinic acid a,c-diamide adenosyltransferase [Halo
MTTNYDDTDDEEPTDADEETPTDAGEGAAGDRARTPGGGAAPEPEPIEPAAPEEFGLVQAFWGDGKGKTTAAMGMGFRAAGHGYRVHMLQFMKGGADSVEGVRGEYNAIAAVPGFTYENAGHYGWHGLLDGSADDEHEAKAAAAFDRAEALVMGAAEADLTEPLALDGAPEAGVHLLILDELLYAADRGLVAPDEVVRLAESKPEDLELVLTGSHAEPDYLDGVADLISNVRKVAHPFDDGQRARRGTEY